MNTKTKTIHILLCAVLFIQSAFLIYTFAFLKNGYHSDEVYNLGFSNSYQNKDFMFDDEWKPLSNMWRLSSTFKDYVVVDDNHVFSFKSVYDNCSKDYNPPLYCFLVHFISSLFPGKFSWYFSFVINFLSFLGVQIYLFKLFSKIFDDEYLALASVILFGFSVGCMDMVIFLRMYILGAFFAIAFLYYSYLIFVNAYTNNKKYILYLLTFATCFFGAFTLHLFLVFAFPVVLSFVLFYLFSKQLKKFWMYGLTSLSAVVLSIIVYPSIFINVGGNNDSHSYSLVKFPTPMQFRLYFYDLTRDLFGIHVFPYSNVYFKYFLIAIAVGLIIVIPFLFVFRKEEWLHRLLRYLKKKIKFVFYNKKNYVFVAIFVSVVFVVAIASERTSMYLMTVHANRYLFIVYPIASLFVCGLLYFSFNVFINKKKVLIPVLIAFCLVLSIGSHYFENSDVYLFDHYEEGVTLSDLEADANCVIIAISDWIVTSFAAELYNNDEGSFYPTNYMEYQNEDVFDSIDKSKPMYLIVDQSFILNESISLEEISEDETLNKFYKDYCHESDVINFYSNLQGVSNIEYVGADCVALRLFKIYKVYFN